MNFKHGKYSGNYVNYCIDCGEKIGPNATRCISCNSKGKLNGCYRHGKFCRNSINRCIDCHKEIGPQATRCSRCAKLYLYSNPENHPRYDNGKSFEEYGRGFDSSLKEQVRFRDNYKCQLCGCSQLENGRQLDVHHIDYNKHNNISTNLVSLCIGCHSKTSSKRKSWTKYFNIFLRERKIYD